MDLSPPVGIIWAFMSSKTQTKNEVLQLQMGLLDEHRSTSHASFTIHSMKPDFRMPVREETIQNNSRSIDDARKDSMRRTLPPANSPHATSLMLLCANRIKAFHYENIIAASILSERLHILLSSSGVCLLLPVVSGKQWFTVSIDFRHLRRTWATCPMQNSSIHMRCKGSAHSHTMRC